MTIGDGIAVAGSAWAFVGFMLVVSHHKLRLSEIVVDLRKNGIEAEIS